MFEIAGGILIAVAVLAAVIALWPYIKQALLAIAFAVPVTVSLVAAVHFFGTETVAKVAVGTITFVIVIYLREKLDEWHASKRKPRCSERDRVLGDRWFLRGRALRHMINPTKGAPR
jgi:hypothetical protein